MTLERDMFIEYTFTMNDGKVLHYKIEFNRIHNEEMRKSAPHWTELEYHKCGNCPLSKEQHSHCPVALDVKEIFLGFNEILSFKEADVWVRTPEREYSKRCDAQTGLRALIGFVMATGDCPILSPALRPMAHFHLPFASLEEIIYRTTSSYMLTQYFVYKDGGEPDMEMDGLRKQFGEIQTVNYDFLQRIRSASEADANLDVLATLFSISSLLSVSVDQQLKNLKPLFIRIDA